MLHSFDKAACSAYICRCNQTVSTQSHPVLLCPNYKTFLFDLSVLFGQHDFLLVIAVCPCAICMCCIPVCCCGNATSCCSSHYAPVHCAQSSVIYVHAVLPMQPPVCHQNMHKSSLQDFHTCLCCFANATSCSSSEYAASTGTSL